MVWGATCGLPDGHRGRHRSVASTERERARLRLVVRSEASAEKEAIRKAAWYENLTGVQYNKRLLKNRRWSALERRRRRETDGPLPE